jgi:Flp pilus assembly protein TadG
MVEFAVALPVFLLLVLGLIDFGRLLFTYVSLTDAAREMARVAAISHVPDTSVISAFNDYALFTSSINPATDQVQVTVADESCASDQRQGNACSPSAIASVTCSLPLQGSCALPPRGSAGGGYVQVNVTYTFQFSPLFQVASVTFLQRLATLTTSEREYME